MSYPKERDEINTNAVLQNSVLHYFKTIRSIL